MRKLCSWCGATQVSHERPAVGLTGVRGQGGVGWRTLGSGWKGSLWPGCHVEAGGPRDGAGRGWVSRALPVSASRPAGAASGPGKMVAVSHCFSLF